MSLELTEETTFDAVREYLKDNIFSKEIIQFILDKGFDVSIQDTKGNSPLIFASNFSKTLGEETVRRLIDAGADLDFRNKKTGATALMSASAFSNDTSTEGTVKILIDAGANVDIQNNTGVTALMLSSTFSNQTSSNATVKMLIDAGVNLDIQNSFGYTALMLASKYSERTSSEETVKILIDVGANVDIQDNKGKTAVDFIQNKSLFNFKLLNQRIRVNITKTIRFEDPIMMSEEDIDIGKYIEEDKDNIVIVYDKNRYFFTNRETIVKQIEDATLYPCMKPDTMKPENILRTKPLYDLKKIGLIAGFPCVINKVFENPDHQLFALINTKEKYPSFVSDEILNRGGSFISGLHCQAGQESKISYMLTAVPSTQDNPETVQMGGVRTLKDIKKFERKQTKKLRRKTNKKIRKTAIKKR
jgi:ankyrin repeat protein